MKLVIPASLKAKFGITGEEKSWVDLCKTLKLDFKGQSAHRLIKTKYPEIHNAICKDCIYDKPKAAKAGESKPVKAKVVKAGKSKAEPVKVKGKVADAVSCARCGVFGPKDVMSTLSTPDIMGGKSYLLCPNCTCSILA